MIKLICLTDFITAFQRLNRLLTTVFWASDKTKQLISFHWHDKQRKYFKYCDTELCRAENNLNAVAFASTTTMLHILPTVPSSDTGTSQPSELQSCDLRADGTVVLGDTRHTDYQVAHG